MFAIFEEAATIPHGPLEGLITVDEEVGLIGADQLAGPPFLKSRSMINLDSEDWGLFFTSSAGSVPATYNVPVTLSGLMSSHTGLTIGAGRANAIKWVVRVLLAARAAGAELRLVAIAGGARSNAIPDSADVVADADKFRAAVDNANGQLLAEFRAIEKKNPQLVVEALGPVTRDTFSAAETAKVLNLLSSIPHGVFQNQFEIPGLVNTSQSLSIVRTDQNLVFARSNEATQINWLIQFNTALAELAGIEVSIPKKDVAYPWPAALESRVLDVAKTVYNRLFGSDPVVTGIHAGLECGAIQNRGYPDLEAISFGPDVKGAHTIEEYTTVETCVKFFELVKGTVIAWAE
jgi:dipeptidase D